MSQRTDVAQRGTPDLDVPASRETPRRQRHFRRALVAARLAAGLTQAELATKVGTTQSAIARLERGKITPTVESLCRLADVLGVHFEIARHVGLVVRPDGQGGPTLHDLRARREEILRLAAAHGARNIRIFGSVARGEADVASDVDVLVDLVTDAEGFAYFGLLEDLRRALTDLLGHDVDVVDSAALRDMRERVLREALPL